MPRSLPRTAIPIVITVSLMLASCQSAATPAITVAPPAATEEETGPPPSTAYEAPIRAEEGLVYEEEGLPRVHVPPAALDQDGILHVDRIDAESQSAEIEPAGPAYEITLSDASLRGPIEIALPLELTDTAVAEGDVFAAYLDGDLGWIALPSWLSDDGQWVHTTTDHLTTFGSFFSWSPLYPRITHKEATPNPIEDVGWPPCFQDDLVVRVDAQDPDGEIEKVEVQFRFHTASTQMLTDLDQFVQAIYALGLVIYAGDVTAALPAAQGLGTVAMTKDPGSAVTEWKDVTGGEDPQNPGRYYASLDLAKFRTCDDYFDVDATMAATGIDKIVAHIRVTDDWGLEKEERIEIPVHAGQQPYAVLTSPGGGPEDAFVDSRPVFHWQVKPKSYSDLTQRLLYAQGDTLWGRWFSWGVHEVSLDWTERYWPPGEDAALEPGRYVWGVEVTWKGTTERSEVYHFTVTEEPRTTLSVSGTSVTHGDTVNDIPVRALRWNILEGGRSVRTEWARTAATAPRSSIDLSELSLEPGEYAVVLEMDRGIAATMEKFEPISEPVPVQLTECYTLTTRADPSKGGEVRVLTEPSCDDGGFAEGTRVSLLAEPETGYEFQEWGDDASGSALATQITMSDDAVVTAIFASEVTCHRLVVSPIPSGQGSVSVLTESDPCEEGWFEDGTVVRLRAVPGEGFKFKKWTANTSGTSASTSVVMDGGKRATASFEPVETCSGTISFVKDVTVPDGTAFDPDEGFTKVWRVRADSECDYPGGTLRFDGGDRMGGTGDATVPAIAAGDTYDISVAMEAPETAGTYSGRWAVSQPTGEDVTFWVSIRVGNELPDVRRKTLDVAIATLESLGYDVTWKDGCDPNYGLGLVSHQAPAAGSVHDPKHTVVVPTRNRCEEAEIEFWADRAKIIRGECTNLHWDVEHVKAIYLDGGGVTGHEVREVCPTATTTYTLRVVTEGDQEITRTVTIEVEEGQPDVQPEVRFWADREEISAGECTRIHWETEHVQAVYYQGQGVIGQGYRDECPSETTTYVLRVETAVGLVEHHITISVTGEGWVCPAVTFRGVITRSPTAWHETASNVMWSADAAVTEVLFVAPNSYGVTTFTVAALFWDDPIPPNIVSDLRPGDHIEVRGCLGPFCSGTTCEVSVGPFGGSLRYLDHYIRRIGG